MTSLTPRTDSVENKAATLSHSTRGPITPARFLLAHLLRWLNTLAILCAITGGMTNESSLHAQPPRPGGRLPQRPATTAPAPATLKLNGVTYINAKPFFARYGLQPQWLEANTRLAFSNRWTRIEIEFDKREALLNGLRIFLGDPITARPGTLYLAQIDADNLFAPILRPNALKITRPLRTIVIDVGHGGKDTGTQNKQFKYDEKNFALAVATQLHKQLSGSGWRVIMTRADDRFIDLGARSEIAAKASADLFLSIHFNAAGATNVSGTETYILTPQYQRSTSADKLTSADTKALPGNTHDEWNTLLGYHIHRQLLTRLGSTDRGLKRARFAVLRQAPCPAVLIEAGYLSNATEARKIATTTYRQNIAEAIATGVRYYAAALDTAAKTTRKTPDK